MLLYIYIYTCAGLSIVDALTCFMIEVFLILLFLFFYLNCFSSLNDNEDDDTADFRKCIRVLADKVNLLSRQREELLAKYPKVEAANEQLRKELDEKKEVVKTLYTKHQLEKQVTY